MIGNSFRYIQIYSWSVGKVHVKFDMWFILFQKNKLQSTKLFTWLGQPHKWFTYEILMVSEDWGHHTGVLQFYETYVESDRGGPFWTMLFLLHDSWPGGAVTEEEDILVVLKEWVAELREKGKSKRNFYKNF